MEMDRRVWDGVMNSATSAEVEAAQVLAALKNPEMTVEIDLSGVQRMTPSFANTFVMRLLHEHTRDALRARCRFVSPASHVAAALQTAVSRYESGIRLSDQPPSDRPPAVVPMQQTA